jgi:hypothetical protein
VQGPHAVAHAHARQQLQAQFVIQLVVAVQLQLQKLLPLLFAEHSHWQLQLQAQLPVQLQLQSVTGRLTQTMVGRQTPQTLEISGIAQVHTPLNCLRYFNTSLTRLVSTANFPVF